MIKLNPIDVELTTAATDFVLGVVSLAILLSLYQVRNTDRLKARYWMLMFAALTTASFLGAVAHGFEMSPVLNRAIWHPLYLSLGLVIAFFVVGSVYELWGSKVSVKCMWLMPTVAVIFYLMTVAIGNYFILFVAYELFGMLISLGVYLYTWIKFRRTDACWMSMGICLSILAAVLQAIDSVRFACVWEFNHDGVFHLVQLIALGLIFIGLRTGFKNQVMILCK